MAREISRQTNRKNRNRHQPKQPPAATESSESEQDEAHRRKACRNNREERNRIANGYSETDGNSNTGEAECTPALRAKTTPKPIPTNSQENAGGESFSKTGDKTQAEPSESERQVGEKGQDYSGKKGFRVSERKRAKRINR